MELAYALLAAGVVSLIAFGAAVFLTQVAPKLKLPLHLLVGLAAGALVGDVFIHLLPELLEEQEYTTEIALAIIFALTLSLIIEAGIHCYNDRHDHGASDQHNPALPYLSLISDGLHNFLDGISIAVSFIISPAVGVFTTIAVIFHEIPQELADVGILIRAGWNKARVLMSNLAIAATALLGVIVTFVLNDAIPNITPYLTAFAIGQLIYVALADLLPEIHHEAKLKTYFFEIIAFLIGVGLMWALTLIEVGGH